MACVKRSSRRGHRSAVDEVRLLGAEGGPGDHRPEQVRLDVHGTGVRLRNKTGYRGLSAPRNPAEDEEPPCHGASLEDALLKSGRNAQRVIPKAEPSRPLLLPARACTMKTPARTRAIPKTMTGVMVSWRNTNAKIAISTSMTF